MKTKKLSLSQKNVTTQILLTLAIVFAGAIFILPFVWMVVVAFEGEANFSPPIPPSFIIENPSFFNIRIVLSNNELSTSYTNSIITAIGCIIVNALSVLTAGYALSKGKFLGKKMITLIILSTMMIPFEVRMLPMFLLFNYFGLTNNLMALILPVAVDGFGIILSKQFFDKIPDSLRESASIDGMNEAGIFTKIYLPLSGPLISTLAIIAVINSWNSFVWPLLVITDSKLKTIPLFISSYSLQNSSGYMGTTMAVAFLAIIPIVIVYCFIQKYVVQSIATSGMKE